MDENLLRIEFDKVLFLLAQQASTSRACRWAEEICLCTDIQKVNTLLKETSQAYMLSGRFGNPPIYGVKEITPYLKRAETGAVLSTDELLEIADTLESMRRVKEWKKMSEDISTDIDDKFNLITANKYFEDLIRSSIISTDEISDKASSELSSIRRKIRSLQSRIRERLDGMIRSSRSRKYLQDSIVTIRNGRFVIPVKAESRDKVPGLVHDASSSGMTLFIEPLGVVEDNNEVRSLYIREKHEIQRILTELSAKAGEFSESILCGYEAITKLDLIFAKAALAYKMKATVPIVNDKGRICVKRARNPLIPKGKVEPIDIELGDKFDTLVITGPNTGGKTVSIKTAGIMCAMSMCGLMIPAQDNSEVSVFQNILTDIGDEQSIQQSLSTFSSHMKNIIKILDIAGKKSLVLIDEIGSGTDPKEGAALAISILDSLKELGVKTIATTHYGELKEYAIRTVRVQNACCEFDMETMSPTYKLLIGSAGSSNAFLISERLGLSSRIINNAREIVGSQGRGMQDAIQKLEDVRIRLEKERKLVENEHIEAVKIKEKLLKQEQELKMKRDKLEEESRIKALVVLDKVRFQAEQIMSSLENIRKSDGCISPEQRRFINSGIKRMEDIADPVKNITQEPKKMTFNKGDNVIITDINKNGTVLSPKDSSGNVLVAVGRIKTRVSMTKLRHCSEKKSAKNTCGVSINRVNESNTSGMCMEVDLRGMNSLDAIADLDEFIDSSIMKGIYRITVIHGKGTGILRKNIHDHLKKHKLVCKFRLGTFGEGEDGVTIVDLE